MATAVMNLKINNHPSFTNNKAWCADQCECSLFPSILFFCHLYLLCVVCLHFMHLLWTVIWFLLCFDDQVVTDEPAKFPSRDDNSSSKSWSRHWYMDCFFVCRCLNCLILRQELVEITDRDCFFFCFFVVSNFLSAVSTVIYHV